MSKVVPSSEVAVWSSVSLLMTVTTEFWGTVSGSVPKASVVRVEAPAVIVMVCSAGSTDGLGEGEAVGEKVGVIEGLAVGLGEGDAPG